MIDFNTLFQIEDMIVYDDENDLMALMNQNEEIYCSIDLLAQYGETNGFNSLKFYTACEEAFVNASNDMKEVLNQQKIFDAENLVSFVMGFAYAKRYFQIF